MARYVQGSQFEVLQKLFFTSGFGEKLNDLCS